jgi:hypothetical protein
MNRLVLLVLTIIFLSIHCNAQKVDNQKMEKVFLDKKDTTKKFYTEVI